MEIRNLMTFVQVAELNSFTKAARALDYSQSTVSFQIKQLENELDCLLFERINHTITLTEKGRELLAYAQQIGRLTEEYTQERDADRPLRGYMHVVAPDSVCEDMLVRNYADFYARYPGISLKFTNADTGSMFRMLDSNEADVIVTLDNHVYKNEYVIAKEEPVSMHFVTGANSPFAKKKNLSIEEIAQYPFILTEKHMGYRRSFDEELARRSLDIVPILEIGRTDLITDLLEQRVAVSYLPDFVTEQKVGEGRLVYLEVSDFKMDIWKQLIYHKNKWMSKSFHALIEYIKVMEFGDRGGKQHEGKNFQ
ncbi:MAG: LysR family transcriptional regulator [Clostridia bacterium]|nr:LysR family transcriptional regulator [Clostridia bacterium]